MNLRKKQYPYPYIPVEERAALIKNPRSVCSIAPAEEMTDCLFSGNGSHNFDVSGHPYHDELTVGQEDLHTLNWKKPPMPPDLRPYLKEIRAHLLKGEVDLADDLVEKAQREAGHDKLMNFDADSVGPIRGPGLHKAYWMTAIREEVEFKNYLRWVDMLTGKIVTHWETEKGVFENKYIAAYDGDVVIAEYTAPEGCVDLDLAIRLPYGPLSKTKTSFMEIKRKNPYDFPVTASRREEMKKNAAAVGGWLGRMNVRQSTNIDSRLEKTDKLFTAVTAYDPEFGKSGFVVVIRFVADGGEVTVTDDGIKVRGANNLKVFGKAVRFENNFEFGCEKKIAEDIMKIPTDFDAYEKSNRVVMGGKMERSQLKLTDDEKEYYLSGEELLERTLNVSEFYPAMLDKLYDMGRFYQIQDTGKIPPMSGQHNINTNLQVCAGNNTGLFEEMDAYFRYYETKFDDFRTNAKLLFNARGLLASVHCDYNSGLLYHTSRTYPHYCWTGCLGWVYNELWNYWLVSGDEDFLRNRVVPAYKEIALFFEDYACDRDENGKVIFYPSFSPEDPTPNPNYNTVTGTDHHATRINSVMDIAICHEVLANLIDACNTLGIEQENIAHWQKQIEDLPIYLTDEVGALKEWAWPTIEENYNHRHVSHHYDVWPGRLVTPELEPEVADAIRISNRCRAQQDDSGHGVIHRAFSAIRLKDVQEFAQNMSQLTCHGYVHRTLATSHNPYTGRQPDPQGAFPALLLEMCVFSMPGIIEFLPALLPGLDHGELDGIWLYTWAKMNWLKWNKAGLTAEIVSNKAQNLTLRIRRPVASFVINGKEYKMTGDHVEYAAAKGEKLEISVKFAD